jgi:hypothetical protein
VNEFPRVDYITSIVALDIHIQINTKVQTQTYRHCAVLLIGNTNYRIKVGDIIHWSANREIHWVPAGEEYDKPESWRNGGRRKLWLNRIVSQQSYAL